MPALADRTLNELLDEVAARSPAPGGGSSAAWACAMAAGLVEMACAFSATDRATPSGARAGELRSVALGLAESELHSYAPVLEALRLPADDPSRAAALEAALSHAADAPLAVAEAATEVAELAAETARTGSRHLRGDAVTGALLAEAACRAAAELVDINLSDSPDDARRRTVAKLMRRAAAARAEALA